MRKMDIMDDITIAYREQDEETVQESVYMLTQENCVINLDAEDLQMLGPLVCFSSLQSCMNHMEETIEKLLEEAVAAKAEAFGESAEANSIRGVLLQLQGRLSLGQVSSIVNSFQKQFQERFGDLDMLFSFAEREDAEQESFRISVLL